MINAPQDSPYPGSKFQVNIDIPDAYPKAPVSCFMMQPIKHVNVEQKAVGSRYVLFREVYNLSDWKPSVQIFQIICRVVQLLKEPDGSQNFFLNNEQNCQLYE